MKVIGEIRKIVEYAKTIVLALCMVCFYPLKQRCNLWIFSISVFDQTIKLIIRRHSATHLSCINAVVHQRTFFPI